MIQQFFCSNKNRRRTLRDNPGTNGIDYLEVVDDPDDPNGQRQRILNLFLIHETTNPPINIGKENILIEGVVNEEVIPVTRVSGGEPNPPNMLEIEVERPGDFSTYLLRIIDHATGEPLQGIDRMLSEVTFSFKVECPTDADCLPAARAPAEHPPDPQVDYLAKDYASFRRLMLDRMAVTVPEWPERLPADLGVALVEVLAYAADQLSYYQDSVGTEAYLGTARSRISTRRHARLLDYHMDEGGNARAWVCLEVQGGASEQKLPKNTKLLTRVYPAQHQAGSQETPGAQGAGRGRSAEVKKEPPKGPGKIPRPGARTIGRGAARPEKIPRPGAIAGETLPLGN